MRPLLWAENGEPRSGRVETYGGYALIEKIGIGGMAEVFLARRTGVAGFEKDIVIKRIRPNLSEDPSFVKMFLAEAKLAAQLSHPCVVQIYDLGRIKDSYFIAMEYVAGRDLSSVIPKCREADIPFPAEYAMKIASSVCEALHFAHTKSDTHGNPLRIVHRDVSPENIRVAWTGAVKILDFGIAKAATQLHETRSGEVKGKLSYMSPEQVTGKNVDARSDVFSLGIVMYEALTGLKLFAGDNELAIMNKIVEGKIYPPSYFREDTPTEVERIVMKALEKDRRRRYQTASDLQFDIDSFLAGHEFTPSNTHLSNFLKQLFSKELEAETERHLHREPSSPDSVPNAPPESEEAMEPTPPIHQIPAMAPETPLPRPPPPPSETGEHPVAELVELESSDEVDLSGVHVLDEDLSLEAEPSLRVSLDQHAVDALDKLAAKRESTPEDVAREIIKDFLKFYD